MTKQLFVLFSLFSLSHFSFANGHSSLGRDVDCSTALDSSSTLSLGNPTARHQESFWEVSSNKFIHFLRRSQLPTEAKTDAAWLIYSSNRHQSPAMLLIDSRHEAFQLAPFVSFLASDFIYSDLFSTAQREVLGGLKNHASPSLEALMNDGRIPTVVARNFDDLLQLTNKREGIVWIDSSSASHLRGKFAFLFSAQRTLEALQRDQTSIPSITEQAIYKEMFSLMSIFDLLTQPRQTQEAMPRSFFYISNPGTLSPHLAIRGQDLQVMRWREIEQRFSDFSGVDLNGVFSEKLKMVQAFVGANAQIQKDQLMTLKSKPNAVVEGELGQLQSRVFFLNSNQDLMPQLKRLSEVLNSEGVLLIVNWNEKTQTPTPLFVILNGNQIAQQEPR